MSEGITIREERITPEEYISFLKRTDLGSQYPKERFEKRIAKLVKTVTISLVGSWGKRKNIDDRFFRPPRLPFFSKKDNRTKSAVLSEFF